MRQKAKTKKFIQLRKKLKFFTSMRVHLFVILVLIGLFSALFLSLALRMDYKTRGINLSIEEAFSYVNKMIIKMKDNVYWGNISNLPELTKELSVAADIFEGRILITNERLKIVHDTYGLEIGKVLISPEALKALLGTEGKVYHSERRMAELTIPIVDTDAQTNEKKVVSVMVFLFSLEENLKILANMDSRIWLFASLLFIFLLFFAFFYSKRFTKPLKSITQSLRHVSEGYMEDKVSIRGFLEMERISDSFNEMLDRIKLLEDSRQEFVSNVSHELKTPITSIKVLADSLLLQEDVPAELYKEFLTDINEEIERENKIITDLLSLVKLDQKTGDMHIAEVNVNELLEIILKRLKPLAQKRNIEIVFESFRPVLAEVDEVKLSLALSNLIENAVKYNQESGWVRVTLNSDHKYLYITVADSGIGIPESEQNLIFDRFYRVDKTRTRDTGGTGLGLSITKNAILMHKGAIKVYSMEGEGTTFTVRIPLSFIS